MSKKSSTPKGKPIANVWSLCEKCGASVYAKDSDVHLSECPPNAAAPNHTFATRNVFYGRIELKSNDPIKGLTDDQRETVVYMSQSAMKLCCLAIGDSVKITDLSTSKAFVSNIWPTAEKSVTSVLISKTLLDQNSMRVNSFVSIEKHKTLLFAKSLEIILLNASHAMEMSNEFHTRLGKHFVGRSIACGNILSLLYFGKQLRMEVKSIIRATNANGDGDDDLSEGIAELTLSPDSFYLITETTKLNIYKNEQQFKESKPKIRKLQELGGLSNEIQELRELSKMAFAKGNSEGLLRPCRGVLLYGQSGTGKTHLAKSLAFDSGVTVIEINATDLYSKYTGGVEENIRNLFAEARKTVPCFVLMDEVEMLCPSRTSRITESEKRIVSCVLNEMDQLLNDDICVFILATTNKLDALDAAFRRCGRFDREIEVPTPNPIGRLEILQTLLGNKCEPSVVKQLAYDTHGFVGADLISLCSIASMHARTSTITPGDFKHALSKVRPSAMREVQIEVPNVKWSDVGGQAKLKLILQQCVEWPLKHPESFARLGIRPPRGVLMYGPPGCSKTMIAKALATESGLNFLSIKGPELFSKWVGESEKAIREVFRKARQVAPSVVFFDEIDALGGERAANGASNSVQERVLAQLLTELDGVTSLGDVTVLAATNRPDRIDNALLRPGRLDRIVYVPLPDAGTRKEIFAIKLKTMPVEEEVDVEALVECTEGYSGAEVNAVCHEAAMMALEEDLEAVNVKYKHFQHALQLITPRTPKNLVLMYEEYQRK